MPWWWGCRAYSHKCKLALFLTQRATWLLPSVRHQLRMSHWSRRSMQNLGFESGRRGKVEAATLGGKRWGAKMECWGCTWETSNAVWPGEAGVSRGVLQSSCYPYSQFPTPQPSRPSKYLSSSYSPAEDFPVSSSNWIKSKYIFKYN